MKSPDLSEIRKLVGLYQRGVITGLEFLARYLEWVDERSVRASLDLLPAEIAREVKSWVDAFPRQGTRTVHLQSVCRSQPQSEDELRQAQEGEEHCQARHRRGVEIVRAAFEDPKKQWPSPEPG
jgi:ribonuclease D